MICKPPPAPSYVIPLPRGKYSNYILILRDFSYVSVYVIYTDGYYIYILFSTYCQLSS